MLNDGFVYFMVHQIVYFKYQCQFSSNYQLWPFYFNDCYLMFNATVANLS